MKLDNKLGLKLAGAWLILWGLSGLGILHVGGIFSHVLPLLALAAGILIIIR
jgi:hypothetical protein